MTLYMIEYFNKKYNKFEYVNKLSYVEAEKVALNLYYSGYKCINIYASIEKTSKLPFLGDKK